MPINGKRLLYHGTTQYHKTIKLDQNRPFSDYGQGYYLTSNLNQAFSWAQKQNDEKAWVFEYSVLDEIDDKLLQLQLLEYNIDWLDVILHYRTNEPLPNKPKWKDLDQYDIIYDRMADGRISKLITSYTQKRIDKEKLLNKIQGTGGGRKTWRLTDQYCFKTPKALCLLHRTKEIWIYKGDYKEVACDE